MNNQTSLPLMRILVTGAYGFIGKNLCLRLEEYGKFQVYKFGRRDDETILNTLVAKSDAIVHLAAENRPQDDVAYHLTNVGLTEKICSLLSSTPEPKTLILASSTQASQNNPYGRSKLAAEEIVKQLALKTKNSVVIMRLPGVFGKWCKPYYNSVVATFCYNIARGIPIKINNPEAEISLVYIDDVISDIIKYLTSNVSSISHHQFNNIENITIGELAEKIEELDDQRKNLKVGKVGCGFTRALYATYISYLPTTDFSYPIAQHKDERGTFVEMLKTKDSGQFSYFTAHPGVTRGCHYHHSKTEKFLVIEGEALFRFKHPYTNERVEIKVSGNSPEVIDSIPGWIHDITNIGDKQLFVMLWANEVFDKDNPDTIGSKID